ncbi:F-box/kelch-repeat protein At3g23880-like [Apium graveolens]|uniref:F-box/kelch-repeat protein At3g23880-like n=1 Tax=Apium graveolens TaxID=4045 RepID=UPI003D7A6AB1
MATTSSTKNKTESTTSFSDLPCDFVLEVFSRLPAKTLIRSSFVSKTWYSLIVSPAFISAQIRHYVVSCCDNDAVLIIPPYIPEQRHAHLISAQTGSVIETFEVPFNTVTGSLKVLGSVNGLLLLTDLHLKHDCRDLYLWNPSVRQRRKVTSSCFKRLLNNREASYYNVGLGFCKSSSDYRVVRIVYTVDSKFRRFGDVAPQAEIYSVRRRTWRKMKDPAVPRLVLANGTYVNGRYYWLADPEKAGTVYKANSVLDELWILSFDFDNERFEELKLPDEVCKCAREIGQCQLMVFEDSLSVCVFGQEESHGETGYPYYIWVMRQENGEMFWDLRFKVALERSGWPMNITKSGTLVIESCPLQRLDMTTIFSRHLRSNRYTDLGFGKCGGLGDDAMYFVAPATVDTSFVESMVMYEGGKSMVKYAK